MMATAFMTEETWVQVTSSISRGLRSSDPIVQANPQWWVLEVFDGHGPHTMSLPAMQLRYDSKIFALPSLQERILLAQSRQRYFQSKVHCNQDTGITRLLLMLLLSSRSNNFDNTVCTGLHTGFIPTKDSHCMSEVNGTVVEQ
jgi:hypothetical protein